MVILMFMDHLYQFIPGMPLWLTWLGRLVAPVFFFLVAEGLRHTSNRWAYFYRLFLFGLAMFVGNRLLAWLFPYGDGIPNNIFLSLALAVAFVTVLEDARKREQIRQSIVPLVVIGVLSLLTEASFLGIPLVLIFFYLRETPLKMALYYGLLSLVFFPFNIEGGIDLQVAVYQQYQWMMIGALPFFYLYSGARGPRLRYVFYLFYPLHIYGLYLAGYILASR